MVVVGVAGLAVVLIAVLVLLLLYGIEQFANLLGNFLPKINLGFTHIDLGGIVRAGVSYAFSKVEAVFDAAAGPAINLVFAPIYVLYSWGEKLYDTLAEAVTTARWIVTTWAPAYVTAVVQRTDNWMSAQVAALLGDIGAAETYARDLVVANVQAVEHALVADVDDLNARITANVTSLLADIGAAETYARDLVTANVTSLLADIGAAETYARDLVTANVTSLLADIGAVRVDLAGTAARIEDDITTAAAGAVTTAVGVIDREAATAAGVVWGDVTDAVTGAKAAAGAGFADIARWLGAIPATAVTDIAGVTALSTAVAGTLARYLSDCGMPNCRNLSKIGRDLQDLFGLVEDGALLALLTELIGDPVGGARLVESSLSGPVDALVSGARDLLGVD